MPDESGRVWRDSWHTLLLSLSWEGSREFHYYSWLPLCNLTLSMCAFQSCAMQQHTCKSREKRKWLVRCQSGFELLWMSWMCDRKESAGGKLGKDTFLGWTRPSLSASVSPSAVSAAKPRIRWCSCCFAHPSYHSAMSVINHFPGNGKFTDIDLIREKSGVHLYINLILLKSLLCVFFWILISSNCIISYAIQYLSCRYKALIQ